jgi:hypothetical protein
MSGTKPVGTELLFATYKAATISVVSASAVTITAGWPGILIPPGQMGNSDGDWVSSLKWKMGGFMTATATVPTWSWGVAIAAASSSAFSAATPLATPTLATAPTAGSWSWKMECEIGLRTLLVGAASTLVMHGAVDSGAWAANLEFAPVATGNALFTTYDKSLGYYLWPYITLGAATAGNQVTAQYGKLYGEN